MTVSDFFNLFLFVSAIFGFIFSFVLFFSKNGKDKSMQYLNLVILSISLNNLQSWVLAKHLFQHKFWLDYIQIPWHFLTIPFFYMFLIHYLNIEKKSFNILKIVLPVFILEVIAQLIFVLKFSDNSPHKHLSYIYERYTSIEEVISLVTASIILGYSFYILNKREKLFPKILSYDNLKWLYTFFKLLAVGYFLWIIALIVKFSLNFNDFIFSYYPLRIFTTVIIFWLGYQGIRQLRIFKERKELRKSTQAEVLPKKASEKLEEHFIQIDNFIRSNKKFLEPKYTLQNLSSDTKLSTSTLSAVINSNANKSFVDYINEMRVEQAKKLLLDPDYKNYTIVSVGLESGFNSKSAFYNVFKKHTNCTPLAFKQQKN